MRTILRAVAVMFFLGLSANAGVAECGDCGIGHNEELGHLTCPIVVSPGIPPADAYEVFSHVSQEMVEDEDLGHVKAYVIHLRPVEWPQDGNIPRDEYGNLKVMLDDGLTFIPIDQLMDEVMAEHCPDLLS